MAHASVVLVLKVLSKDVLRELAISLDLDPSTPTSILPMILVAFTQARLRTAVAKLPLPVLANACEQLKLDPDGTAAELSDRLLTPRTDDPTRRRRSVPVATTPQSASSDAVATSASKSSIAYSPEQLRAIEYRGGHLQVIASAGSGKTEVLAQRIATLLDEGVDPQSIVAFTFTNEAAAGLKARVLRKAQERGPEVNLDRLSPMFVGTIHGYCLRFLQDRVPRYATFDLYTDHRLVGLLTREYHSIGLEALGIHNRTEAIGAFVRTADVIENELIKPSALPEGPFRTAYENYLATLDRFHVLTFNQAIARAIDELSKPEVFRTVHRTLKHLIVDEFQDINPAQAKLITLLSKRQTQVCVVGDDDQAIYQWRGSSVTFIRYFAERFNAHTETLATNRRSHRSIVECSAQFANSIANRLPKEISASRDDHPQAIHRFVAPDAKTEALLITDAIESMHRSGIEWRQMALLFRSMYSTAPFLELFDERKIPYRCEGRSGLFLQPEAEVLSKAFAWMAGREDVWDPRKKQKETISLENIVQRATDVFALTPQSAGFLSKILPLLKAAIPEMSEANLVGIYYRLLHAMGVPQWNIDDPSVLRRLGTLGRFSELLADYESVSRRSHKLLTREDGRRVIASGTSGGEHYLDRLVDYISYYAQDAYRDFTGEPDHEGDSVVLSSVHAAKGLEWPVVFVPGLSEQRFPSKFAGTKNTWLIPREAFPAVRYEGTDEDERRLFYVAMTRARDHLFLSSHHKVTTKAVQRSPYFLEVGGASIPVSSKAIWTPERVPSVTAVNTDKPTFSFSDLAQFNTCPLQYRLRKNLGFQPSGAKEMGYGRAVHHLMRRVAEHVRGFGSLPEASDLDALIDREFYLPYADRPAWESMEARARSLVEGYIRDFPEDLQRVWEVERPFELHLQEANIVGRADVILDHEGGVDHCLAVVDYKTRKVAADDGNTDMQVKAYAAAARGEGHDVRAGYLHDLTAAKGHARHTVEIDNDKVAPALMALDALAKRVRAREYVAQAGPHCGACDVRPLCKHAATEAGVANKT